MRFLPLLFALLVLNGCTALKAVVAMNKGTDNFQVLKDDHRVRYEAGAERNAQLVANHLDHAIEMVETRQYSAFAKPLNIYVTATWDSLTAFCVHSKAGGCVLNERLFISSKAQNTPDRLPGILTHELSHLHMAQHLGMWKWNANVPAWFREGLAVYVSGGSGAEKVSVEDAITAILSGESFGPNETGSLLFPKSARYFGLAPHMFYRQAGLFVTWLHDKDSHKFAMLIKAIQTGKALEQAMFSAYGRSVSENWQSFVDELKNGENNRAAESV